MIVNMVSIRMDSKGNQLASPTVYRIRAHKPPVLPERFEPVCDDAWQHAYRTDPSSTYPLRLTTWMITQ